MGRFDCPSSKLSLKSIASRTRRAFWVALILAAGAHLSLTQVRMAGEKAGAVKPLTTRFVKREPRLVKPLELKKRPRPKPRPMRRKVVMVKAKISRGEMFRSAALPFKVLDNLAKPKGSFSKRVHFSRPSLEIESYSGALISAKEPESRVDMSLEMIDIEALDTGKYQAMVIQDPRDKKKIKGFLHLVLIHVQTISEMAGHNIVHTDAGIAKLIKALNDWTGIKADIVRQDTFDSPETLKTPWIYITSFRPFELSNIEYEAVGKYITSGGFLFCDEHIMVSQASYVSVPEAFKRMFREGFESRGLVEGRDWEFGNVPDSHPLFHCYYDFDGPPIGYTWPSIADYPIYHEEPLIGVFWGDRLVGIITRRSYVAPWYGVGWALGHPDDASQVGQRKRALEFGINTIIFALTQEGSITHQVMQMVE